MNRPAVLCFLVCILFLVSLEGFSQMLGIVGIHAGVIFIGNADTDSAPSPTTQMAGITVPIYDSLTKVQVKAGVFSTLHQVVGGVPLPVEIEVPGQTWVQTLDTYLNLRIGVSIPLSETFKAGIFAGPTLIIRFPIATSAGSEDDGSVTFQYFLDNGRFFYPDVGIYADLDISELWTVSLSLSGLYPIYRLWDSTVDESSWPFWHELIITGTITFLIRLW